MPQEESKEITNPHIRIYKQILDGTRDKFPRHFWKEDYESAPAIVRYLIIGKTFEI